MKNNSSTYHQKKKPKKTKKNPKKKSSLCMVKPSIWAFFEIKAHHRLHLIQVLLPVNPPGCKLYPPGKTILFWLPSFFYFFFSCSIAGCFSFIYYLFIYFHDFQPNPTHPIEYYCLRHTSIHPSTGWSFPSLLILLPSLYSVPPSHTPPNVPPIFRIPTKI